MRRPLPVAALEFVRAFTRVRPRACVPAHAGAASHKTWTCPCSAATSRGSGTCVRASMHACVYGCVHECVHSCIRSSVCSLAHACVCARMRAGVRACARACARASAHEAHALFLQMSGSVNLNCWSISGTRVRQERHVKSPASSSGRTCHTVTRMEVHEHTCT